MAIKVSDSLPAELRFEPTPRRVRAELDGETLADSDGAILVWEPERGVPGYAFPEDDVNLDLLAPVPDPGELRAAPISEAWTLAGPGGGEPVAWRYEDPDLAGYVAISWHAGDRWLEEDEEVLAHPRDPFKRVDVRRSSRHVVVRVAGEIVADTRRPLLLFETGLPVRYYVPREDVRMELLDHSETLTRCAYKGEAIHLTATIGDGVHEDVAWSYLEPLPDSTWIEELVAFYPHRAEITVDGEPV